MANQFYELFSNKTVGDVWPLPKPVISVKNTELATTCLKIYEERTITSMPVTDSNGSIVGIIDLLDFVHYLDQLDGLQAIKINEKSAIQEKAEIFAKATAQNILDAAKNRKSDFDDTTENSKEFRTSTELMNLASLFCLGFHRAMIFKEDGQTPHAFVSQTDLLQVLGVSIPLIPVENRQKTIRQAGLGSMRDILFAHRNDLVVNIISKMSKAPLKFRAFPVLDDEGKAIATFSATNLRQLNQSNFEELWLPVYEFLQLQASKKHDSFLSSVHVQRALRPVTCTLDSTIEQVIMMMVALQLHRVWCVDSDYGNLIGVITLSDIFQVIMPQELIDNCTVV